MRALGLVVLLTGCSVELVLPGDAEVNCTADAHCPGDRVCVLGLGRCLRASSACVLSSAGGFEAAADGTPCSDDPAEVCRRGVCEPTTCGDGATAGAEECDWGQAASDTAADACRSDCRNAHCGDDVIDTGELCDDGAANSDTAPGACRTDCQPSRCGDDVTDTGEECDDGASNDDVIPGACRTDCTLPRCGDGVTDPPEECDDADAIDGNDCTNACRSPACGDRVVWDQGLGAEACDEAFVPCAYGLMSCLACDATCQWAPGPISFCGDGVVDAAALEECDDGGVATGDGCDDSCRLEPQYACVGAPSRCAFRVLVDRSAPPGGDGRTWATAFDTLSDGVTAPTPAGTAVEIWVAAGTYRPDQGMGRIPGDRTASIDIPTSTGVYGGFAGGETNRTSRDPTANVTILSGDLAGDDPPSVPFGAPPPEFAENSCTLLRVSLGSAVTLDGLTLRGTTTCGASGGMDFTQSEVTLRDTVITEHLGTIAIEAKGGELTLENTRFAAVASGIFGTFQTVRSRGARWNGSGVAIFAEYSTLDIDGDLFEDNARAIDAYSSSIAIANTRIENHTMAAINAADSRVALMSSHLVGNPGGAVDVSGLVDMSGCVVEGNGATSVTADTVDILDTTFVGNVGDTGGALSAGGGSVRSSRFFGNTATEGGGIYARDALQSLTVFNSVLAHNSASGAGGALYAFRGPVTLINTTVAGNTAAAGGGVRSANSAIAVVIANSVLWGNAPDQIALLGGATLSASYTCIDGMAVPGLGNLACCANNTCSPGFLDPDGADDGLGTADDDLRLDPNSACVDAGDNAVVPLFWSTDAAQQPRFTDNPSVADTGAGSGPIVDLGPFEAQAPF